VAQRVARELRQRSGSEPRDEDEQQEAWPGVAEHLAPAHDVEQIADPSRVDRVGGGEEDREDDEERTGERGAARVPGEPSGPRPYLCGERAACREYHSRRPIDEAGDPVRDLDRQRARVEPRDPRAAQRRRPRPRQHDGGRGVEAGHRRVRADRAERRECRRSHRKPRVGHVGSPISRPQPPAERQKEDRRHQDVHALSLIHI